MDDDSIKYCGECKTYLAVVEAGDWGYSDECGDICPDCCCRPHCECKRPGEPTPSGHCTKCVPCECGECDVVGGTCEAQSAKYDEEETPEAWVARMRSDAGQAAYVARLQELVDASKAAGIPFTDADGRDIKCAACNCRFPNKQLGNGSYVHTDCIEDDKCSGCAGPWLITINTKPEPVWPFTYRAASPPPPPFDGYCDECRPE